MASKRDSLRAGTGHRMKPVPGLEDAVWNSCCHEYWTGGINEAAVTTLISVPLDYASTGDMVREWDLPYSSDFIYDSVCKAAKYGLLRPIALLPEVCATHALHAHPDEPWRRRGKRVDTTYTRCTDRVAPRTLPVSSECYRVAALRMHCRRGRVQTC